MTMTSPVTSPAAAAPAASPPAAGSSSAHYGFGDDFTFDDFLDIINPLQHIPVVGTIYRAITGDTMKPGAEIAGATLYAGPVGLLLSVGDVAFAQATGKPIDETMLSWVGLDGDDHPAAVAQNPAAATASAAPHPARVANAATTPAAATAALPSRSFPAQTRRIVPLAGYAQPPAPATTTRPPAPVAATATAPRSIVPPTTSHAAAPAPQAVASQPAPPLTAAPTDLQGAQALLTALRDSGVDPASAARAAAAYQATLTSLPPMPGIPADDGDADDDGNPSTPR